MVTWIPHLYTTPLYARCRPSVVAFWQFPRWFIDDWPGKPGGLGWRSWFVYLSWNYPVKEIEKACELLAIALSLNFWSYFRVLLLFSKHIPCYSSTDTGGYIIPWQSLCWVAVCMTKTEAPTKSIRKWNLLSWCWCSLRPENPYLPKIIKKILSNAWGIKEPWMLGRVWKVVSV